MLRHLPDRRREVTHFAMCVPQAVLTRQLDTGAVRDIVQKVFPLIHGLHEALPCLTDELIGPLLCRLVPVVVILQQFRRLREGADEPPDVRLLFFRGSEFSALICQQLHSFPCCNIVHPVSQTCRVPAALEIGRDQYDPCHVSSSSNRRC